MNEDTGLMAQATLDTEGEDNQTAQEPISHVQPEAGPASLDDVTVAKEGEDTEFVKPDYFPDKFWDEEQGPDVENLVKSYNELQKKFSQGKHKVPDAYDDSVFKNANIPDDDPLLETYRSWAKENGVSQSAFDQLATSIVDMAEQEDDTAQISFDEEYKKLGPNADAAIKSMTDWASSLVRKGVWSDSDFEEFRIMGGTAQGLRALQKVRSYYGDKPVPIDVGPIDGAPSKEELNSMVGKPEYLTDPAYRAKVEKMFEQVYGTRDASLI